MAWWPPLLLLLLPILLFRQGLGTGMLPFGGDVLVLNYPLLTMIKGQMLHGQLPLWNGWAGGGYPLVPFSGLIAYPLVWPIRFLDVPDAITLMDIAHMAIAGVGVYLLGNVTGATRVGRTIGALAFALSGFMIAHVYAGHLLEMGVIAWMPWVFYTAHRLVDRPGAGRALAFGTVLGLQVLANGLGFLVFTAYPVAVLLALGVVAAIRQHGRAGLRLPALIVLSGAVGAGLSGVVLLPFAQSLGWSVRAGGLDFAGATQISLPPAALLMLFSSGAAGTGPDNSYRLNQFSQGYWHEFALYVGLLPLLAAVAAVVYCRRQAHIPFYAWLTVAGLVLALGRYTPVYGIAFHLPAISLVRVPARSCRVVT